MEQKTKNWKDFCHTCIHFNDSIGVCSKVHANIESNPRIFKKKCDGKFYVPDEEKKKKYEKKLKELKEVELKNQKNNEQVAKETVANKTNQVDQVTNQGQVKSKIFTNDKFEYKVMPFIGKIKGRESAVQVSDQLEALINEGAQHGWEFVQLENVNIEVQPGCLASLFGASVSYTRFDMAIFKRK